MIKKYELCKPVEVTCEVVNESGVVVEVTGIFTEIESDTQQIVNLGDDKILAPMTVSFKLCTNQLTAESVKWKHARSEEE